MRQGRLARFALAWLAVLPAATAPRPAAAGLAGAPARHELLQAAFARQGEYLGSDSCLDCHGKAVNEPYLATPMGKKFSGAPATDLEKKNCESCHGPGEKHAAKPKEKGLILTYGATAPFDVDVQNSSCLQCHSADGKRHWESQPEIGKKVRCTDCHRLMKPTALTRPGGPPPQATLEEIVKSYEGQYAGQRLCLTCHAKLKDHYEETAHGQALTEENGRTELMKQGCESCHGPGKVHAYSGGGKDVGGLLTFRDNSVKGIRRQNEACLQCHESGSRTLWEGSAHQARDVACTSCHQVMRNVSSQALLSRTTQTQTCARCHDSRRAQTLRNSHMPLREGKMECSSCHNPHGSVTKGLLAGDSPNDACFKCHADKRGPFLWDHAPVGESCMNCHDPHGSTREKMLKVTVPRLCQQCHIEILHPTEARLPTNKLVIGRACLQCHQNIHGSNHPSGFAFTR
jgi:DmsE family decaheme c-type cytochrome